MVGKQYKRLQRQGRKEAAETIYKDRQKVDTETLEK
jgi:hypothetical protein